MFSFVAARRSCGGRGRFAGLVALSVALVASSARAQEPKLIDDVRRSGFIFVGTVRALGAATPSIVREPNSAVVKVERVLEALAPLGNPAGHDVTVRLRDPQRLRTGDRAVFFTYLHAAGATLGLVEVASQPVEQAETLERAIREARAALADEALAARLASAERVVVGVFGEPKPVDPAHEPESEHDPMWWFASIRVRTVEKGAPAREPVVVNFAHSDDVVWAEAPKPRAGAEGIFLLQPDREKRFKVPGLFLLDPLDALPASELERVRRLLGRQR